MGIFFHKLVKAIPESLLTAVLVATILVLILVLFRGNHTHKAIACAYILLP